MNTRQLSKVLREFAEQKKQLGKHQLAAELKRFAKVAETSSKKSAKAFAKDIARLQK